MHPISELNNLPGDEFADALKPLFEAAAPLADALYARRPFESYPRLIDIAESLAREMSREDQAAILGAHPRIGASPESMSAASYAEQGYATEAGIDAAKLERVYTELANLNQTYEQRFGFRFVVFVNRRPKTAILEVLEQRLQRTPEEELQTGLHDMFEIARDRYANSGRFA